MTSALPATPQSTASNRAACLSHAAAYFDDGRFAADLARRVALATESDQGYAPPSLHNYLTNHIQPDLLALGFTCTLIDNPAGAQAGPLLIARRIESPDLPTVLTYGHGDVVSGQATQWRDGLNPWQLTIDGDRWYGRGTADNKGQHTINLAGLAAAIQARQGRLGYNVTVLFETGEEAASPGLHQACTEHRALLQADLLIACDGPRLRASTPTLFLGSRGAVNFTLSLHSRDRGYHSGNWGGVLTNPGVRLAHALATLADPQGRILVDALRPTGIPASVRQALADVQFGGDPGDPTLNPHWGEPGLSAAEQLIGWNTIEVLALGAGNPQRPVNAIPPSAQAHCQLRFVVGTPWQDLQTILRQHLDARGFDDIAITITLAGAATRLDPDHGWVRWAKASIQASSGQAPAVLPNLAGSLPNDVFADLLGMPTLWVPHSYPACAQHAPNEHLLGSIAREGLQIMAGLYWDLGEPASGTCWP